MDYKALAVEAHKKWRGKISIEPKMELNTPQELAVAYTPGVAEPCLLIEKDESLSFELTGRANTVAVITDGTAVLGLGDIGPAAGMPVMEGKCVLFKAFGGVDAIPLCIDSKDTDDIVKTIKLLSKSFGGINLEDIAAPRCFEIEKRLKEDPEINIPIFHDDQHGTAIVTVAGLENAVKLVGKKKEETKAVISGAGAAGIAIAKLMMSAGYKNIILCNSKGIVSRDREYPEGDLKEMSKITNPENLSGSLADALKGADIFVGVSKGNIVTKEMAQSMNKDAIVFAMANPIPEIMPDVAKEAGVAVMATGRSDFPNQINNVLVFPGVFRGAFDAGATDINDEMKLACAYAIASLIGDSERTAEYIIPGVFDKRVGETVAKAVREAAVKTGVIRK